MKFKTEVHRRVVIESNEDVRELLLQINEYIYTDGHEFPTKCAEGSLKELKELTEAIEAMINYELRKRGEL